MAKRQAESVNNIQPPLLDDVENRYPAWREDIRIWNAFSTLQTNRKGPALYLSLPKMIQDQVRSRVKTDDLVKDTGMDQVLDVLDELYMKEDVMTLYEAFEKFEKCKRRKDQSMSDFISEFELLCSKLDDQDMTIPDKFKGIKLLKSANLPESKEQLMKATATDVGFVAMRSKLKSVFCDMELGSSIKEESIKEETDADDHDESVTVNFTNNSKYRGRGRGNQRGQWRQREDNNRADENSKSYQSDEEDEKKVNPPSKCKFCFSIYHWYKDCPRRKAETYFTYTNQEGAIKAEETTDSMVIDCGAPRSVCGIGWYTRYVDSLQDTEDITLVRESTSEGTFRFGDSEDFKSILRVEIPIYIGSTREMLTVDVVECDIPCLLSISALSTWKAKIDFDTNTLTVNDVMICLQETTTGHLCLPVREKLMNCEDWPGKCSEQGLPTDNLGLPTDNSKTDAPDDSCTADIQISDEMINAEDIDQMPPLPTLAVPEGTHQDRDVVEPYNGVNEQEADVDMASYSDVVEEPSRQKLIIKIPKNLIDENTMNQLNKQRKKEEADNSNENSDLGA